MAETLLEGKEGGGDCSHSAPCCPGFAMAAPATPDPAGTASLKTTHSSFSQKAASPSSEWTLGPGRSRKHTNLIENCP